METTEQLESICKLRQRLVRLIKLGEPNQVRSSTQAGDDSASLDLTANVEECVRRLFGTSDTIETFVQNVQQILHVTLQHTLILFLIQSIPLAHRYLQQRQHDPYSWETFKSIPLQASPSTAASQLAEQPSNRLPSLQQAQFRLPPSCPQLVNLPSSLQSALTPQLRLDADPYQQKLIIRFARKHFHLSQCGERTFLQTLYNFLRYILRRLHFFAQHRLDTHLLYSDAYERTSNVREQIRFLIDLNKSQHGDPSRNLNIDRFQQRNGDFRSAGTGHDEKRLSTRDYRLSVTEGLRQRETDETACLVLRESRLKRQKTAEIDRRARPSRVVRANLQDLIAVMENETILRRSKTLIYAYAHR